MPVILDAQRYGSDRDARLLKHYARHFALLSDREITLLEIGVRNGASLRLWADYFPRGRIVGLDMAFIDMRDHSRRISVYQGLQQDVALLDRIAFECAPEGFDIVIDDASHIGAFTRISFWHLLTRHMKAGGIYVIEDWGTGYWENWPDGRRCVPPHDSPLNPEVTAAGANLAEFPSHVSGLVGVLKEIVDEVGMGDLSRSGAGATSARASRIERFEIVPGLAFVTRAASDH